MPTQEKLPPSIGRGSDLLTRFPRASAAFLRLNKHLFNLPPDCQSEDMTHWTEKEVDTLKEYYAKTPPEVFSLYSIAKGLGKTHASVALKASRLGLSNGTRAKSTTHRKAVSDAKKAFYQAHPEKLPCPPVFTKETHPRGMLGKRQNPEHVANLKALHTGKRQTPDHIDKRMKTRLANFGTLAPERIGTTWKQGWREVNGERIYFRSRWEYNYALYLEFLRLRGEIQKWEHEPETFWFEKIKRGCRTYLPDFRVTLPSGMVEYHEVKGWMDPRSITKIKRMAKYHPKIILRVIDGTWFKANGANLRAIIPAWETK